MSILITGTAGFIGFHLARVLLEAGHQVTGYDGMTDYYDTALKRERHRLLSLHDGFSAHEAMLEDMDALARAFDGARPRVVVHLAAQAGVLHSLKAPRDYINSNVVGTFNVMEAAHAHKVDHLLMASTSSVYGANESLPFSEREQADTPLTIYAATKKACEAMGHSYAHIHGLPTTMFRFFTVYGPWGRPDMALFKFTRAILEGQPIDVYNNGDMRRDFTYVDDLVHAITLLIDKAPPLAERRGTPVEADTLSRVAPFRIVNIGNADPVRLLDFIEAIEAETGRTAIKTMLPMQKGDVPATFADTTLLTALTGYRPKTDFRAGVRAFVEWYRAFYAI